MIGGQDLHARADLSLVTDGDRDDVQDHAVEVEEDMRAEADVEAVVAVERRADDASLADGGEALERSEEHTSELQSLMRNSYAVFCLKKKNKNNKRTKIV